MDRPSRRQSSRGVKVEACPSTCGSAASAPMAVKSEPGVDTSVKTEGVEDVTEDVRTQREQERKRKADEEAIDLSSSSEEEDDDEEAESDFQNASDDEDEESDAWDEDVVEEGDDEPIEVEEDIPEDEDDNKPKRLPPLEVLMEQKDMPAAPGKPSLREDANDAELEEGSTVVNGDGRKEAARAVKDRIIKLLNTGFHDESNEHEAKNAMKLAQKLMKKYDLSQAILLKEREKKNEKDQSSGNSDEILKGGIVRVQILNRRTGKVAVMARWIGELVHPICKNFDVKSFHQVQRGRKCTVSFYGIFTNCQLAAYAFKVATERISQMCDEYKPEKPQQSIFSWGKKVGTKSSRLSYGLGIVEGIDRDVDRNIRMEKAERERKLERARIAATRGEAFDESDGEECGDWQGDTPDTKVVRAFDPHVYAATKGNLDDANIDTLFDHQDDTSSLSTLERVKRDLAKKIIHLKKDEGPTWIKEQKAYWKEKLSKEEFKEVWKPAKDYSFEVWEVSRQEQFPKSRAELEATRREKRLKEIEKEKEAAIVLVNHREKVADQVLKDQNIKLRSGRKKRSNMNFDSRSYYQGVEDAKEIDINQRAIRDGVKVKKEGKRRKR